MLLDGAGCLRASVSNAPSKTRRADPPLDPTDCVDAVLRSRITAKSSQDPSEETEWTKVDRALPSKGNGRDPAACCGMKARNPSKE